MSSSNTRNFTLFSQDKLKAAVRTVNLRRRRGLYLSLGSGLGVFLVLAAAVFVFFSPYRELMGEHNISYWPLMLLAPLSISLIVFCLIYIITLRQAVKEFRETLVGKIAEFIDPAIVHENGKAFAPEERDGELLATFGGVPSSGTDEFRGRVPGAAVHFRDIRVKRENVGVSESFAGVYFRATMEKKFSLPLMVFPSSVEVSRSDMEAKLRASGDAVGTGLLRLDDPALGRQILVPSGGEDFVLSLLASPAYAKLEAVRKKAGAHLCLSCRGDALRVMVLAPAAKADAGSLFDEFDFARCREFCQAAALCLELARGLGERGDLWKE